MGAGVAIALGLGAAAMAGGGIMSSQGAGKRAKELRAYMDKYMPTMSANQRDYFNDLYSYSDDASKISSTLNQSKMTDALRLREQALPGMQAATGDAMRSISPLLRGELPAGVMDAFSRAGGASTVGLGFGGSGFGALNTGLFGARGALGAIQTGMGRLPSLLSTMPQISLTSPDSILNQLLTPMQRTQTQLTTRGQNLALAGQAGQIPTMGETMGGTIGQMGGLLMGGAMGGMMGGGAATGWGQTMQGGTNFAWNPMSAATGANMNGAMNQAQGRLY
jgi:hypothetical protein